MNIFYTDHCPKKAANNLCKVHINKMYQESCQLLSTAIQLTTCDPLLPELCKITHQNHPSAVWVRQSIQHYDWLLQHAKALRALIDKPAHGYDKYLQAIEASTPPIADLGFTNPPKCINTTEYPSLKNIVVFGDVCTAYKDYLKTKYKQWTTRTDKRKMRVEFINGTPDYMIGVI